MQVTRQLLVTEGASYYLAKRLTDDLKVVSQRGKQRFYNTADVVNNINQVSSSNRTRKNTKQVLARLWQVLTSWTEQKDPLAGFNQILAEVQTIRDQAKKELAEHEKEFAAAKASQERLDSRSQRLKEMQRFVYKEKIVQFPQGGKYGAYRNY